MPLMKSLIALIEVEIDRNCLIEARGSMSLSEAAGKLGISKQSLWLVETGQRRITNDLLERIIKTYGISLSRLKPAA